MEGALGGRTAFGSRRRGREARTLAGVTQRLHLRGLARCAVPDLLAASHEAELLYRLGCSQDSKPAMKSYLILSGNLRPLDGGGL